MSERELRRWLWLIMGLYFGLAMVYSVVTPLAETPDESEHFRYLQHIVLTGKLPVIRPVYEENETLEAHQPPGLYLLGAALTGWIEQDPADNLPANSCFSFDPDDDGRQHAYLHRPEEWPPQRGVYQVFQFLRWLDVLFGLGTVWLAYRLGRQVMPGDGRLGLWAAALLAFNPQWIHITASFNNDVPTTFLGAAIVYLCIRVVQAGRMGDTAVLGLLLGLGFLTKFALFAFWPLAFLAIIGHRYGAHVIPRSLRRGILTPTARKIPHSADFVRNDNATDFPGPLDNSFFILLLLVAVLPLLVAGWWYGRNFQLYGDPLLWEVTLAAKGSVIARAAPFGLADIGEFLVTHFQSYWLWFGWLTVKGPVWVYGLILVMVITAVTGLLYLLWRRHLPVNWVALAFCALGVAAIYASLLQYAQTVNWTGYQGRLAFAAAAPIAALLALGLYSLNRRWLGTAVAAALFTLAVLAVPLIILPAFPRPQIYQPAPDLTRTCMRFAGGLQVEAVQTATAVKPGEWLPVTVYGYGLRATAVPQTATVRLVGRDGQIVGQAEAPLTWDKGEVVSATLSLPVVQALPARGVLEVGMVDETGQWQVATSATGRVLQIPLAVEVVKIAPARPFNAEPEVVTAVQFGDQLKLLGYDYDPAAQTITLYWQVLAPLTADYTTFVHILDEQGQIITQADGQPQMGAYPTSLWDVGEMVADDKKISLPVPGEDFRLAVGVYLLETGERLPAHADQGVLPDNRFILPLRPDETP
ncbi:MAG TPA: glycosyltransferase family 39 protein [Chloroflexota bacterium]|nr:glycosyltransferase family 39 protein [Chloroflexota bacterium]